MSDRIPPTSWKPRHISYSCLKKLHPTTRGIHVEDDILKSIQMVIPNAFGYKDSWFHEDELHYLPSQSDKIGNAALKKALEEKSIFRAYCGFKRGKDQELEKLGIPRSYFGKSYDLGRVKIKEARDGIFVICKD